jgi:Ca2+-binding RTX toxin-like protein
VTITRTADNTQAIAAGTVVVGDAALTATAISLLGTEGTAISATVATFEDADPNAAASDFAATIHWGDGSTSTGTIIAQNGGFAVDGTHAYAEEGNYQIGVTILDIGGSSASTISTASVADAPLTVIAATISGTEGTAINATVATFSDADHNVVASDFTAMINWGDGMSTAGTVVAQNGGGFAVDSTHAYAEEGNYQVGVTINDVGGSTTTATSTAVIADAPVAKADSYSVTLGHILNVAASDGVLSNDTDADNDLTATIQSQPTHGSVTFNADGSFSYTPNADFVGKGTDTFTYAAVDGTASSAAAKVTINISEGSDTFDFSGSSANTTVSLAASSGSAITQAGVQKLGAVDNVIGGHGNNTIIGNNFGDILNGGAGNDTIRGGTGNDFLIAGAGNDRLTGGGGNDTFVFRPGFGQATVTDFITGNAINHDTLDLRGLGFASINDVLSHTDTGANAVVHAGASQITLFGVTEAQLAAHQFDISI